MTAPLAEILKEIRSLEPLPQVAMRVLEIGARSEVVPNELISVIQTDAAMTAKVLRLCNSAYYGFRREIASLPEAGNLLGVSALVNLVLTSCAEKYFRNYGGVEPERMHAMWEMSISNALAASLLARISGAVDSNRAYTAGLLQNIGETVLEQYFVREEARIGALISDGTPAIEAERAVLGIDHAEVGARLCERWGFPDVLIESVRCHHEPEKCVVDPLLACYVHLGEQVTMHMSLQKDPDLRRYPLDDRALDRSGFDPHGLTELETRLATELVKAREFVEAI